MLRDVLKLGLLLETPAYRTGRAAFEAGEPVEANPHSEAGRKADWDLGWRDARRAANGSRAVTGGDAYAEGRDAAAEGIGAERNPYLPGSPGFDRWRLGWVAGKAG